MWAEFVTMDCPFWEYAKTALNGIFKYEVWCVKINYLELMGLRKLTENIFKHR